MKIIHQIIDSISKYIVKHMVKKAMNAQGDSAKRLFKDFERWKTVHHQQFDSIEQLYIICPEFRTLFHYRIGFNNGTLRDFLKVFHPPLPNLYIRAIEIGSGLYIQHGFSTTVGAKQIGENCWINQQVTIGHKKGGDAPTIGHNVSIGAGSIIIGDIRIGDNSIIGAGSVVVKTVPDNCTVVGNPARIVKKSGNKSEEKL
jgi:serine O-acetyltransferase